MIRDWPELRDFALSLELPEVTLAYPFGNEALKAFGRMWCYWGRGDGAVFKADKLEREFLMQADPGTFFLHPHYAPYDLVLVRAGRIDPGWARARLIAQWRAAAPKRFLKAWDDAQASDV
jgi:hypothetical protein